MERPTFTLVVVGTCPDAAVVEKKLGELLSRKFRTHRVVLQVGGSVRTTAADFSIRLVLAIEAIPDADAGDELGTDRNTTLLTVGSAFVAFGIPADWPRDVRDLILRANASGLRVRECAGEWTIPAGWSGARGAGGSRSYVVRGRSSPPVRSATAP